MGGADFFEEFGVEVSQQSLSRVLQDFMDAVRAGIQQLDWAQGLGHEALLLVLAQASSAARERLAALLAAAGERSPAAFGQALLGSSRQQLAQWHYLFRVFAQKPEAALTAVTNPLLHYLDERIPSRKSLAGLLDPRVGSARRWAKQLLGAEWYASPEVYLNIEPISAQAALELFRLCVFESKSTSFERAREAVPAVAERCRRLGIPGLTARQFGALPQSYRNAVGEATERKVLLSPRFAARVERSPLSYPFTGEYRGLVEAYEAFQRDWKDTEAARQTLQRILEWAVPGKEPSDFVDNLRALLNQHFGGFAAVTIFAQALEPVDYGRLLSLLDDNELATLLAGLTWERDRAVLEQSRRVDGLYFRLLGLAPDSLREAVVRTQLGLAVKDDKLVELVMAQPPKRWEPFLPADLLPYLPRQSYSGKIRWTTSLEEAILKYKGPLADLLPDTAEVFTDLSSAVDNWLGSNESPRRLSRNWLFQNRPGYLTSLNDKAILALLRKQLDAQSTWNQTEWFWNLLSADRAPDSSRLLAACTQLPRAVRRLAAEPNRAQLLLAGHLGRNPSCRQDVLSLLEVWLRWQPTVALDPALLRVLGVVPYAPGNLRLGTTLSLIGPLKELAAGQTPLAQLPRAESVFHSLLRLTGWADGEKPTTIEPASTAVALLPVLANLTGLGLARQTSLEVALHVGLAWWPILEGHLLSTLEATQPGTALTASYRIYTIAKKNGKRRIIQAPNRPLKTLQRALLDRGFAQLLPHDCATGFRPGYSTLDNARPHERKRIVAKVDVESFFPSTRYASVLRVCGQLWGATLSPRAVHLVAELCTVDGGLPTGAPTSPAIANLVLKPADAALATVCQRKGVTYTRFADDLTFSSDSEAAVRVLPFVSEVLRTHGYRLAHQKTGVFRRGRRQTVTGLVVNEKATLSRPERRLLRAMVEHRVHGKAVTRDGLEQSDAVLRGHLSYLALSRPDEARGLLAQLGPHGTANA